MQRRGDEIMLFQNAVTRMPGEDFAQGITTSHLGEPDYTRMIAQHQAYSYLLSRIGLEVTILPPLPGFPDAYFVEDPAVVTPQVAVITIPGAESRCGEVETIAQALSSHRRIARILPPGTLEGGDVLMVEKHFFIGLSERTNLAGAQQLGTVLEAQGFSWEAVPVKAGLHFKSSVNYVGKNTLIVSSEFATTPALAGYEKIILDTGEEYAANTLFVNDSLITPRGFPKTRRRLEDLGYPVFELDVSEARKMDGGLTCMSLRF